MSSTLICTQCSILLFMKAELAALVKWQQWMNFFTFTNTSSCRCRCVEVFAKQATRNVHWKKIAYYISFFSVIIYPPFRRFLCFAIEQISFSAECLMCTAAVLHSTAVRRRYLTQSFQLLNIITTTKAPFLSLSFPNAAEYITVSNNAI